MKLVLKHSFVPGNIGIPRKYVVKKRFSKIGNPEWIWGIWYGITKLRFTATNQQHIFKTVYYEEHSQKVRKNSTLPWDVVVALKIERKKHKNSMNWKKLACMKRNKTGNVFCGKFSFWRLQKFIAFARSTYDRLNCVNHVFRPPEQWKQLNRLTIACFNVAYLAN